MNVVVIGGVAAGMSAAAKARRLDPKLKITVFERSPYVSYGACGLPYVISGEIPNFDQLIARTPEQFRKNQIDVLTRHEVLAIDPHRRRVAVHDLSSGTRYDEPYDRLLIATGASPQRPPIAGIALGGVFTLRTIDDGRAIDQAIQNGAKHAVVVGGGYIGLEMVEAFAERGLRVSVVEMLPNLMANLDQQLSAVIEQSLAQRGIAVSLETRVLGFEGDGRVQRVNTSRGVIDAVDLVLVATGVRPNSELARVAGLNVAPNGAIVVDAEQRTSADGIWAAGDVATVFHRVSRQQSYIPLGDTANKQGKTAGIVIAGGEARFGGVLGTSISKVFELGVGRTGLNEREATALGWAVQSVQIAAADHAHYYPDHRPIHVRLTYRRGDRRLLGGQIVGFGDAVKRIDTIAAMIHAEASIDDLAELDMAYAPPFSPVWDPLLIAAGQA